MTNSKMRGQRAWLRTAIATVALIGGMSLAATKPVFAQAESQALREGTVTVYMANGRVMQMQVGDKAMLDAITRDATVLDDHTMVVMHNGKLYLVKDHKMAGGAMISDMMAHMNQH